MRQVTIVVKIFQTKSVTTIYLKLLKIIGSLITDVNNRTINGKETVKNDETKTGRKIRHKLTKKTYAVQITKSELGLKKKRGNSQFKVKSTI